MAAKDQVLQPLLFSETNFPVLPDATNCTGSKQNSNLNSSCIKNSKNAVFLKPIGITLAQNLDKWN